MQWNRTKLTISRWEAFNFRITETGELGNGDHPYTLESLDPSIPPDEPTGFGTLESAKMHAELLNALAIAKEDNQRLRSELAQVRGFDAEADDTTLESDDDGRGIPKADAIAGELIGTMARNAAAELQGMIGRPA